MLYGDAAQVSILWVADDDGRIGAVDTVTHAVTNVPSTGHLTDIAFTSNGICTARRSASAQTPPPQLPVRPPLVTSAYCLPVSAGFLESDAKASHAKMRARRYRCYSCAKPRCCRADVRLLKSRDCLRRKCSLRAGFPGARQKIKPCLGEILVRRVGSHTLSGALMTRRTRLTNSWRILISRSSTMRRRWAAIMS